MYHPAPQGFGQPPPQGYGQPPPQGYGQPPPQGYGQPPNQSSKNNLDPKGTNAPPNPLLNSHY
jgi:hypothetical protein